MELAGNGIRSDYESTGRETERGSVDDGKEQNTHTYTLFL